MKAKKRGFTIVEMLVVTSILSLLSSVVLTAVSDARVKADDVQRNKVAEEYIKALALAYDADGGYPYPGNILGYCLGNYAPLATYNDANVCGSSYLAAPLFPNSENSTILVGGSGNAGVKRFLPTLPVMKSIPMYIEIISGNPWLKEFKGPVYRCSSVSGGVCNQAMMYWLLDQPNQKCAGGAIADSVTYPDSTSCTLALN